MIVSAIAAIDRRGLMGDGMKMPWRLPRDLKRFRAHTLGKPVLMGRRTFESLRAPLPGRLNIVLSHDSSLRAEGCYSARSIPEALAIAAEEFRRVTVTQTGLSGPLVSQTGLSGSLEIMIIGGGVVFAETVPLWDRLLLTVVEGQFQGDTYFPLARVTAARWNLVGREFHAADAKNAHAHWFLTLERPIRKVDNPLYPTSEPLRDFDLGSWLKS
jgi:dihydrofolate reductase